MAARNYEDILQVQDVFVYKPLVLTFSKVFHSVLRRACSLSPQRNHLGPALRFCLLAFSNQASHAYQLFAEGSRSGHYHTRAVSAVFFAGDVQAI